MSKIINFLKYNNATIFILLAVFLLATGVFAQTETGQNVIGQKQTSVEGIDNTLLIEADLDAFNMDYKIEKIESDEKYYYVTYTYLDLIKKENVWLYEVNEKVRKLSKDIPKDLGVFVAEELSEQNVARISELKEAQAEALQTGEQSRVELSEYSGLIGQSLELASKVFPDYQPVQKIELPHPSIPDLLTLKDPQIEVASPDNLTNVYNEYVAKIDIDGDELLGSADNCPDKYNPTQTDDNNNGIGDACEKKIVENPTASVDSSLESNGDPSTESNVNEVDIISESEINSKLVEPPLDNTSQEEANADAVDQNTEAKTIPESEKDVEVITIDQ